MEIQSKIDEMFNLSCDAMKMFMYPVIVIGAKGDKHESVKAKQNLKELKKIKKRLGRILKVVRG